MLSGIWNLFDGALQGLEKVAGLKSSESFEIEPESIEDKIKLDADAKYFHKTDSSDRVLIEHAKYQKDVVDTFLGNTAKAGLKNEFTGFLNEVSDELDLMIASRLVFGMDYEQDLLHISTHRPVKQAKFAKDSIEQIQNNIEGGRFSVGASDARIQLYEHMSGLCEKGGKYTAAALFENALAREYISRRVSLGRTEMMCKRTFISAVPEIESAYNEILDMQSTVESHMDDLKQKLPKLDIIKGAAIMARYDKVTKLNGLLEEAEKGYVADNMLAKSLKHIAKSLAFQYSTRHIDSGIERELLDTKDLFDAEYKHSKGLMQPKKSIDLFD
ncbi:MAG: hypothetical protein U9R08_02230 [Nanoarchaeota archaeon]|nr:hypothetical protein [Nanoarchaeota archaeon]